VGGTACTGQSVGLDPAGPLMASVNVVLTEEMLNAFVAETLRTAAASLSDLWSAEECRAHLREAADRPYPPES
jgi:hypothetical protein